MTTRYRDGPVSRFVDYTSSGDPVAKLILVLAIAFFVFSLLLVSLVVVVPIAAVVALIVFLYRSHKRKALKISLSAPESLAMSPPTAAAGVSNYPPVGDFGVDLIRRRFLREAEAPTDSYSCAELHAAFANVAATLYAQESFPAPPAPPDTSDPIALARYRDQLETWQSKAADKTSLDTFLTTYRDAYMALREHFPTNAFYNGRTIEASPFTVPLHVSMNASEAASIAGYFASDDLIRRHLFGALRSQIDDNYAALVQAGAKEAGFLDFFANTALAAFEGVPIPVPLPDETRFAGMWVIAPQGMGKTTLLHDMINEDIAKDASIILMDSKGDLIEPYLNLNAISRRRVVIGPDNPIGINPLDIPREDINKAVDNLEYLFSSLLDFKLTAMQSMLLKAVLRALVTAFPSPTLATFQDIMSDGPKKYVDYIKTLDPDLQNFFKNEWNTENIKARRQEVLQRLRLLLDNDLLRSMLTASSTTFRIGEAMDQGAVIIINNSRARLGNKGAEFFGRFFIAQVLAAAQQRSFRKERDKKPVYFYIDEAHTVIAQDERVTDILHECRSQKIGLILAHQETTQVSEKVLSALQNCAIRFAHPDEEARKLAGVMRIDAKTLQSMHRGQFAAYVRGLSKEGFVINVPKPDFSRLKAAADPQRQKPGAGKPAPKDEPIVNFNPRPPEMEPWRLDSADDKPADGAPEATQRPLEEQIKARFEELHPQIQQVINSDDCEKYLRSLTAGYDEDAYLRLENEVMLVLMHFQPVNSLLANLETHAGFPPEYVRKIGKGLELFVEHILEQASNMPPPAPMTPPKEPVVNLPDGAPPKPETNGSESLEQKLRQRFSEVPKLVQAVIEFSGDREIPPGFGGHEQLRRRPTSRSCKRSEVGSSWLSTGREARA